MDDRAGVLSGTPWSEPLVLSLWATQLVFFMCQFDESGRGSLTNGISLVFLIYPWKEKNHTCRIHYSSDLTVIYPLIKQVFIVLHIQALGIQQWITQTKFLPSVELTSYRRDEFQEWISGKDILVYYYLENIHSPCFLSLHPFSFWLCELYNSYLLLSTCYVSESPMGTICMLSHLNATMTY